MQMADYILKFNEDFYKPVIDEVTTSTIRGNSKPLNIGDYVYAQFSEDNVCIIKITNHYAKRLKDLTIKEAEREGYKHVNLLKHELKNIYPNIKDDDYVYVYHWHILNNSNTGRNISKLCDEFIINFRKGEYTK